MSGSDQDGTEPGGDLVTFPRPPQGPPEVALPKDLLEPSPGGDEDIVWFDPELLARRSEIGVGLHNPERRAGWWCPEDLADPDTQRTPCWGALAPSPSAAPKAVTALWNDPQLPLVRRFARAQSLAITAQETAHAYALLDQMLESLVVSNLFEREPESHRALLVSQRSAQAWWQDLTRRWAHTQTPEGHAVDARHPDFARHWLLVNWEVWDEDSEALLQWLGDTAHQRVIGFHLPRSTPGALQLVQHARARCQACGHKLLVAGHPADLDALAWDPRDRLSLSPRRGAAQFELSWSSGRDASMQLGCDPASGVFYL